MAKSLRIDCTLANVALTLGMEFAVDVPQELDGIVKKGMENLAYRGGASKAFKGVKERDSLSYDDKVARLTKGLGEVGLSIISHEPYVAPEQAEFGKRAAKLWAEIKAQGPEAVKKALANLGLPLDIQEDEILKAIHKKMQNPLA